MKKFFLCTFTYQTPDMPEINKQIKIVASHFSDALLTAQKIVPELMLVAIPQVSSIDIIDSTIVPSEVIPQSDYLYLKRATEKLGVTMADASHYAQALVAWTRAGFPVREQSEVERIERDLCRPCEHYVEGRCNKCGCRVTKSSLAIFNKIKMATEKCPVGKWS